MRVLSLEDKKKCFGCTACFNICPQNAVHLIVDTEGFKYPKVNYEKCVKCGLCIKVCPIKNKLDMHEPLGIYAAKNISNSIRMKSSSGGVFTALAEYVLLFEGIVYGAAFDDKFCVVHARIDNVYDLESLRGSKYVQSDLNDTFRFIKKDLCSNKMVLFSGTPCQCAGLKKYLNLEYDNLIILDLVCYGVPSPKIFSEYIEYIQRRHNSKVKEYVFRDKSLGWRAGKSKIKLDSNKNIHFCEIHIFDELFWSNLILRPACYDCRFTSTKRIGDITLGDFWGMEAIDRDFVDEKGVSLCFVNNTKGEKIFEIIKNKLIYKKVFIKDAIKKQDRLKNSVEEPENRSVFWIEYSRNGFEYIIRRHTHNNKLEKVKFNIKNIIKNILGVSNVLYFKEIFKRIKDKI